MGVRNKASALSRKDKAVTARGVMLVTRISIMTTNSEREGFREFLGITDFQILISKSFDVSGEPNNAET